MFNDIKDNKLYDFLNELEIELFLHKGKTKLDICEFLDDISLWMEKNKSEVSKKYFPLAVLAVGPTPVQVSAFLYGFLVGKGMQTAKLKLTMNKRKMGADEIQNKMKDSLKKFQNLFEENLFNKETDKDDQEKPKA